MNGYDCWDEQTGQTIRQKYPQTKEDAIKFGLSMYWPGTFCPVHPTERSVHYVKSGKAMCCVHSDAGRDFIEAISLGEPSNPQQARIMGYDYYWQPAAFSKCGHVGMTTLTNKCYTCYHASQHAERPRQKALEAGNIWYTPINGKACEKGHVGARRRVANGSCEQCELERKGPVEVPFHRQYPDLILSYEDAKAMGLAVYRTGKPCKLGHTGWRYVSTRGCMKCMGRE